MLRVTRRQPNARDQVIRLEGRLTVENIPEVRRVLDECEAPDAITIELAGLTAADSAGLELLRTARAAGGRLWGGSVYINRLLEEIQR